MYIEENIINKYISYWLMFNFFYRSLMIVVGGLTRLTDSGLINNSMGTYFSGIIPPFNIDQWNYYFDLYKKIPEYNLQNYLMTFR